MTGICIASPSSQIRALKLPKYCIFPKLFFFFFLPFCGHRPSSFLPLLPLHVCFINLSATGLLNTKRLCFNTVRSNQPVLLLQCLQIDFDCTLDVICIAALKCKLNYCIYCLNPIIPFIFPSRWENWTMAASRLSTQCGRVLTPLVTLSWMTTICPSSL